ncbi:MAG: phage shock protein operon transcriptional activator [Alphaproteobacteria bacterium]|nr:phage shock protein operon transcriptional activator [Alphaproteobacteria bacterium]
MATPSPPELIGQSPAWMESLEQVSLAALVDRPILVIGERGTGKELIAERLHFLSPRWEKPYVKVNCAALSEDLLDSELFGHEAGSFTGATKRRHGRFEQANGGTLFLDEVATASMKVQEKLLRVVEYGQFQRLGGEDMLTADVRVVAAANVDLPSRCEDGRFRADLLDRLAFDVVTLAPLRARGDDIDLLAEYFGGRIARELEATFPGFHRSALQVMHAHEWPGNVRELKNVAERATFRALAAQANGAPYVAVTLTGDVLDPFASPWRPRRDLAGPMRAPPPPAPPLPTPDPVPNIPLPKDPAQAIEFEAAVRELEQRLLAQALGDCAGHQRKAAERLGLSYHQMRGLLRKYGYGRAADGTANGATDEGDDGNASITQVE